MDGNDLRISVVESQSATFFALACLEDLYELIHDCVGISRAHIRLILDGLKDSTDGGDAASP